MGVETGLAVGACAALAVACVAHVLALPGSHRRREWIAIGARTSAAILIVAALALTANGQGGWRPFGFQQAALSLALAMLVVHLGLLVRLGADGAGPVSDGAALAITLVAVGAPTASLAATCPQRSFAYHLEWILLLLGAGATLVAGSASLLLAQASVRPRRKTPIPRATVLLFVRWATRLSLLALGAGLGVGLGWAWRATGTFTSSDSREVWMAVTGLISVVSLLAWRLPKRSVLWAASLALLAAACAILGLLALPGIRHLSG